MRTYYHHDQDPPFEDVLDGVFGYWRRDNTPEGEGRWFFIPDLLDGETSGERTRRVTREMARSDTPKQKRMDAFIAAGRWLQDHPEETPVLRVRCTARSSSGKGCRGVMAKVYKTPQGYYLWDALCYPFAESRVADLELAMEARVHAHPLLAPLARVAEAAADIPLPIASLLSSPHIWMDLGDGVPRIVFGCQHHGNTAVNIESILAAAKKNFRTGNHQFDLQVNPQDGDLSG